MASPDHLRARVFARIAAEPSRTRAEGRRRAQLVYAVSGGAMVLLFEAAGGFAHGVARPWLLTAGIVLGAGVVALTSLWMALGRAYRMTGRAATSLTLVVLLVPAATFLWLDAWHGTYPDPEPRFGWRCIGLTLAMGGALLGAAAMLRRGAFPDHPLLHGAAAGAAAGATAGVLVDAWCPLTDASHVLQGHVLPIVVLTMFGALLGTFVLKTRAPS